jgi:hypothetical protein
MIRIGGGRIIILVTIDAFDSQRTKIKQGRRSIYVAIVTVSRNMRPHKGKTAFLMEFCNIVYDP